MAARHAHDRSVPAPPPRVARGSVAADRGTRQRDAREKRAWLGLVVATLVAVARAQRNCGVRGNNAQMRASATLPPHALPAPRERGDGTGRPRLCRAACSRGTLHRREAWRQMSHVRCCTDSAPVRSTRFAPSALPSIPPARRSLPVRLGAAARGIGHAGPAPALPPGMDSCEGFPAHTAGSRQPTPPCGAWLSRGMRERGWRQRAALRGTFFRLSRIRCLLL